MAKHKDGKATIGNTYFILLLQNSIYNLEQLMKISGVNTIQNRCLLELMKIDLEDAKNQ